MDQGGSVCTFLLEYESTNVLLTCYKTKYLAKMLFQSSGPKTQSDACSKSAYLKDEVCHEFGFLDVVKCPQKLQIYYIISSGCGQACPKGF